MRNLIFTLILSIPAFIVFSQNKKDCTLDLRDDYAIVVETEIIHIPVFNNDIGSFDPASARILELPGCGPYHGWVFDPDNNYFDYSMNHVNCPGADPTPGPNHFFDYLDTFEYYVQLVCDDYCKPGDGKIWTIESEYLGTKDVAKVVVITKKGVPVDSVFGLHTGDYFTIDGTNLPVNQTDWDYTFTFSDNTAETVRVHTSCSQLIFGVDFGLLKPISGCIATYDEKENGACNTTPFQRGEINTREDHIFPKIFNDTAMVIIETEAILPIHILDFSLASLRNKNQISWSIANVANEEYIALEKSYDGIEFFELKKFDEVIEGNYTYVDVITNRSVMMHYYRLAIMHYNGEISYSNVIMGRTRMDYDSPILVYPNPTSGIVTLELLDEGMKMQSLFMDDISGKRLMYIELNNNKSITLSLTDRAELKGIYFIGVELSNGEVVHKRVLLTQ